MRTYAATAHREDDWWVAEIEGLGATQGRTVDELYWMIIDFVVCHEELQPGEFEVVLTLTVRHDWATWRPRWWRRLNPWR